MYLVFVNQAGTDTKFGLSVYGTRKFKKNSLLVFGEGLRCKVGMLPNRGLKVESRTFIKRKTNQDEIQRE